jgi:hypothetical protein
LGKCEIEAKRTVKFIVYSPKRVAQYRCQGGGGRIKETRSQEEAIPTSNLPIQLYVHNDSL